MHRGGQFDYFITMIKLEEVHDLLSKKIVEILKTYDIYTQPTLMDPCYD